MFHLEHAGSNPVPGAYTLCTYLIYHFFSALLRWLCRRVPQTRATLEEKEEAKEKEALDAWEKGHVSLHALQPPSI